MRSPKATAIVACLLVGMALVFVFTQKPDSGPTPKPIPTRNPLTRTKLPPRGVTPSQLIASSSSALDRKSWAKGLSDEELKRLAREMIHDHQQESNESEATPWICTLAMEWGRRDFDGMIGELETLVPFVEISGIPNAQLPSSFHLALRTAAIVGLAEDDAPEAWNQHTSNDLPSSSRTNADFISPIQSLSTETSKLAAEAIFRSWAENNAKQAWSTLTSDEDLNRTDLAGAIQGLLGQTNDPSLRDQVIDWIKENHPFSSPPELPSQVGEAQPITRKTIDGILNNPNRHFYDPYELQTAVAIGIAAHDPTAARAWIKEENLNRNLVDPDFVGRVFTDEGDNFFLTEWAQRDPDKVTEYLENHPAEINPSTISAIANGMSASDPRASLDVFSRIEDPKRRAYLVEGSINLGLWGQASETWPLIDDIPEPISSHEALQILEQNLFRLQLSPKEEEHLRRTLQQSQD